MPTGQPRKSERTCVFCGNKFIGSWAKYCSKKCTDEHYKTQRNKTEGVTDLCTRGHDMSKYRKSHPNGDTYCYQCASLRTREWNKANPDKVERFQKTSKLQKAYGITIEEYEDMLSSQGGACAICLEACSSGRKLAVDHDHDTGKVAGLLCASCNGAIGMLRYNKDLFFNALEYVLDTRMSIAKRSLKK